LVNIKLCTNFSFTDREKYAKSLIMIRKMTPKKIAIASKCILEGVPQQAIADQMGVDQSTIYRAVSKPEVREIIEREAAAIITEGLEPARKTLIKLAEAGTKAESETVDKKLALDASKHITSIAGLSGGTPGTIINQLIQINSDPETTKEIQNLKSYLQTQWTQGQTIDAKEV